MMHVLNANLRIEKTGRTKGNSRLWRSLTEETSILSPESKNTNAIAQEKGIFLVLQILQVTSITVTIHTSLPTSSLYSLPIVWVLCLKRGSSLNEALWHTGLHT
eukprot:scaffold254330_cov19-Tisochrysis_lutea.AAC.2